MVTKSVYYNGNPHLPKANAVKEFDHHKRMEIAKCARDPVYFAEKYFKIVHQDHGLIDMKLFDYQRKAIKLFTKHRKLLMAASRQCGKTTFATVVILHTALFNENKNIALLANKADTAKEILERVKLAYEHLPDFLKGGIKEWNKKSIEFENGTKIFADATSGPSIRGKSIFLLYVDENAFIEDWESFSASVLPTISSGETTKMIFTSTPNGLNHFFHYYENAKKKTNGFQLVEVPWWEVPGRDEAWKASALAELNFDEQKFEQEYAVEFLGSSGTLINGATLKILVANVRDSKPLHFDKGLSLYANPEAGHRYVMVVDTSRGRGLDYSAFHVIDISTMPYEQVCTYRNNLIATTDYASVVHRVANHFNKAQVLIELNDMGEAVADMMHMSHEYEELLSTENRGRAGKQISAGYGKRVDRGITTTTPVKNTGCAYIKAIIEQFKIKINDKHTVDELNTFSAKGKSYEAEPGNHDDLVMGLVLFGWLTSQDYFKQITDRDILQDLKEETDDNIEDYLLPFGVINDGIMGTALDFEHDLRDPSFGSNEFDRWMYD